MNFINYFKITALLAFLLYAHYTKMVYASYLSTEITKQFSLSNKHKRNKKLQCSLNSEITDDYG